MRDLFSQDEEFLEDSPLQNLPIGIQDFEKLRQENFLYVDKTKHLYRLIKTGRAYFLSRPRRFGKSLMISTLESIFKARKDLFENTWILNSSEAASYDWKEYPVLRLDMGEVSRSSKENLEQGLLKKILSIASDYGVYLPEPLIDPASALSSLIEGLVKLKNLRVVVLIDEYDKPILDNILDLKKADEIREILRNFYTIFKSQDGNIHFLLLTGVTKFTKVSIFSGLNNPDDLTLTDMNADLVGYTQQELENNFMPYIKNLARKFNTPIQNQLEQIKTWYNGYQFSAEGLSVYNPFSVLKLFQHESYQAHWFETGTPGFLMDLLKKEQFNLAELNELQVGADALSMSDINKMELVALLYQTGYLTITGYDREYRAYDLNYPNLEVKTAFTSNLLSTFSGRESSAQGKVFIQMNKSLIDGDYDLFFENLKIFIAGIPYTQFAKMGERDFQTVLFLIFTLLGYRMNLEVYTSFGRLDAVLETKDQLFIFEYKVNQTAQDALNQIKAKKYFQPYLSLNKKINLIGMNFSVAEKNIDQWIHELL